MDRKDCLALLSNICLALMSKGEIISIITLGRDYIHHIIQRERINQKGRVHTKGENCWQETSKEKRTVKGREFDTKGEHIKSERKILHLSSEGIEDREKAAIIKSKLS